MAMKYFENFAAILFLLQVPVHSASIRGCDPQWKSIGNFCYTSGYGQKSWSEANYDCKRFGGELARVDSSAVNNFLFTTFVKGTHERWIGLKRCGGSKWCFSDGTTVRRYFNWARGEPNNYGGYEGCAVMQTNGYWNDGRCPGMLQYICQKRRETSSSITLKTLKILLDKLLLQQNQILGKLMAESELGTYQNPGKSCADILQGRKEKSLKNGDYWIIIDSRCPMKVFCDMKTDGGGWTLISNLVLSEPKGFGWALAKDYRQISDYANNNLGISTYALAALRAKMPFKQLRFHCHKKVPGRTFDIVTTNTSLGKDVVEYFTARTNSFPKACGSFYRLDDDNSILSRECSKWGRDSGKYYVGKWQHDSTPVSERLFIHTIIIRGRVHWHHTHGSGGRWECDDYVSTPGYALSTGDFWKIYVR